jgi:hypothetical protein
MIENSSEENHNGSEEIPDQQPQRHQEGRRG